MSASKMDPETRLAPVLTAIDPNQAEVGAADVTLRALGTDFTPDSQISFGGVPQQTTQVSDTELNATIAVPGAEGPVPVLVDTLGTPTATVTFQVVPAPTQPSPPPEKSEYEKLVDQLVQVLADAPIGGDEKLYAIKTAERRLTSPETVPA